MAAGGEDKARELRAWLLDLYARVVRTELPPDAYVGGFLRRRSQIRGSGRGFLAAVLFALLRKRQRTVLLARSAGRGPEAFGPAPVDDLTVLPPGEETAAALLRWMVEDLGWTVATALEDLRAQVAFLASTAQPDAGPVDWKAADGVLAFGEDFAARLGADAGLAQAGEEVRLAARYSLPLFLLSRWQERFGAGETALLAESLQATAPLHLRVNTRAARPEKVLEALRAAGVQAEPGRFLPECVRLGKKVDLRKIAGLQDSWYEVQDEGSQLITRAVGAQSGWRVLDACAGAGGKSLHLADLAPQASIFAHDLSADRLKPLPERLDRAGIAIVTVLEPGMAAGSAPFDAVLIDAPCLGLGRLRREPATAWGTHLRDRLEHVARLQAICLNDYAPLVKPGGVLVYATCSFEPEETTAMLQRFLADHPKFEADPLPELFQEGALKRFGGAHGSQATLLPHAHGTDGFFVGRMRRRKGGV